MHFSYRHIYVIIIGIGMHQNCKTVQICNVPKCQDEGRDFGNYITIPQEFGNSCYIHFKLAVILQYLPILTDTYRYRTNTEPIRIGKNR